MSPNGPNDCEYGAPPSGRPFTTTYVLRAAAPTRQLHQASFQACTTTLSGEPDPAPANNCRSITIRLVGRR